MLQLQFSRLWLHLLQWSWGKGFTGFGTLHQGQVTETGAEGLVSAERCQRQIRSCGQDGSCGAVECSFTWEGQSSSSTHCGFWRHLRTCLGLLPPKAPRRHTSTGPGWHGCPTQGTGTAPEAAGSLGCQAAGGLGTAETFVDLKPTEKATIWTELPRIKKHHTS